MITKPEDICLEIESSLVQSNLFSKATQTEKAAPSWRVSPEPYYLSSEEILFFEDLGCHLLKFYTVLNSLYADSVKGKSPLGLRNIWMQGNPMI